MHVTRRAFTDVGNYTMNSTSRPQFRIEAIRQAVQRAQEASLQNGYFAALTSNPSPAVNHLDALQAMNGHDVPTAVASGASSANGAGATPAASGSGAQREERFSKTNIYLRGLRESDTDETLKEMVAHVVGADNIKSSRAIIDSRDDPPHNGSGSSSSNPNACRGYGFIDFKSEEIAQQALEYLKNNEQLRQERPNLEVKFARDNEKDPTNIYLQGMPLGFRQDKELEELFKTRIGGVSSARVMVERRSNDPTGVAFVRFTTPDEAQRAIAAVNSGEITIEGVRLEAKLADKHNPDERRRRTRHTNARSATSQNGYAIPPTYITQAQYLNFIASNHQLAYPTASPSFYHSSLAAGNRLAGGYQLSATPTAPISPAAPPANTFGPLATAYPSTLASPAASLLQQQLASSQNAAMAALVSAASGSTPGAAYLAALPPTGSALGSNSDLAGGSYQNLLLQQQLQSGSYAASDPAAAYAQYAAPFVVQGPGAGLHADQAKL